MNKITLLDGGMGQELVHRAGDKPTPLWSTQVMIEHPGLVEQVHRDYFNAGATIATTNTYAIHRDRLVMGGIEARFEDLNRAALAEATAARAAHGGGRIAGSIGPLGASYRADKHPPDEVAIPLYAERIALMQNTVDLIVFETVASVANARSAMQAAADCPLPVWIAFTLDDENGALLRSGELLADALPHVAGAAALLANCSAPEAMPAALTVLKTSGKPFGAYANGFTRITKDFLKDAPTVDALTARDLSPAAYADHVMAWVDQGATIVGGCCETGPAHIAEIARRLQAAGFQIT
ncbi:homocysteine S-methyltransferase family protein [Mesobacterium sp. TK19101]|uniref:Homocysteine S-methyltransferase family protein n=1 Tax=Mesobacterium hydrothermale TaxID=3111907 RepID=A0ABU6HEX2_9RHOB|nr:homocysteine S-methyltransferase family protein [Mesobacterium sp. TK19101]MEC3860846.1 homocysteine S-methyltransferase family protein [Mesobacterium sp. TK19101]